MKKVLSIEGMSCGHCVRHITSALSGIQGVTSVQVDLAQKRAVVEGSALDDIQLTAAVADAGYQVVAIAQ
jgi:Cu2+-exporting ATPase/Cu+-exporting ATPase